MCGLAGSISKNNQINEKILQGLRHRGPDDQTFYKDNDLILYHTRLAILDVAAGVQPMKLGEDLVIAFNGEIYNHEELRAKFNLTCSTRSDTETLLHLYKKLGIEFLNELDGMFAIALYDRKEQLLWLARDRSGKKPLYYYCNNGEWLFASELNVIRAVKDLEIKEEHFYEYLRLGSFYRSHTPYKNVAELPGAHYIRIHLPTGDYSVKQWWNIKDRYLETKLISKAEALIQLEEKLDTAVKRRIESSDLEVGCFLSGGIDSGLVATVASKHVKKLKTFTVAFPGAYNEAPLAKLVANKIQSHHTEIDINFSDLESQVEGILANYGEPFMDSSAIPTWYVSREAKKHVTVILNGDGADELFGGYRRYVPFARYDFFEASRIVKSTAKLAHAVMPVSHEKKSMYNYIYRLAGLAKSNSIDSYLGAGSDIFEGYTNDAFKNLDSNIYGTIQHEIDDMIEGVSGGLKKLMLLDFNINLFGDLLVKMDIGTMAHALEGRSPLLCKEFLDWVPSLPDQYKISGKTTKVLLRDLAGKLLPAELVSQPKRGFEIPLKNWVDGELKGIISDYILSSGAFINNFVKPDFVRDIWNRKINPGNEKRAKMLWTLFAMEVWHKKSYLKNG